MPIAPRSDIVRRRYDALAPFYEAFEWIFVLPPGIRRAAVAKMALAPGDCVLELGCGTGRNLRYLREAVGPAGHIYGVDLSDAMLSRCRSLSRAHGWANVTLVRGDALEYVAPLPLAGALFSLSYGTMQRRRELLRHVWQQLAPHGRLVVMDAKSPGGYIGRLVGPLFRCISSITVFGDPALAPWRDLREFTEHVEMEQWSFGTYFICCGTKETDPYWAAG